MSMKKFPKQLLVVFFSVAVAYASSSLAQSTSPQSKPLPSWAPDSSCMQEYEKTTQHSARCKEQLVIASKRMQEESEKCTDAMQKMYGLCGIGPNANEACYKKHRPDLSAACSGM